MIEPFTDKNSKSSCGEEVALWEKDANDNWIEHDFSIVSVVDTEVRIETSDLTLDSGGTEELPQKEFAIVIGSTTEH